MRVYSRTMSISTLVTFSDVRGVPQLVHVDGIVGYLPFVDRRKPSLSVSWEPSSAQTTFSGHALEAAHFPQAMVGIKGIMTLVHFLSGRYLGPSVLAFHVVPLASLSGLVVSESQ